MAFEIVEWKIGGGVLALSPIVSSALGAAELTLWRPDVVVSLTSQAEIKAAKAEVYLADGRWRWEHHAIEDFGVPDADFEAVWPQLSAALLEELARGGRVLVHCKGGCGRSGMIVVALMVALGRDAGEALAEVRAKRPCAVETDAQMQWASKGVLRRA